MSRLHMFLVATGISLLTMTTAECRKTIPPDPNSDSETALFATANQLYKDGKFKRAMKAYEKIPNKSAYVNYNLGNCAYKLKKYGHALLYWRRAERYWGFFNRGELLENISLLQKKVLQKSGFPIKKRGPIVRGITKFKNHFISRMRSVPLIILQILFLLLWIFVFTYLRFLYKKRKKGLIVALFTLIAFFGIILVVRYSFEARTYGVVIKPQAAMISGPGKTFQTLQQLPQAIEVMVKKESGEYYKIKALKRLGWIHKNDIKII